MSEEWCINEDSANTHIHAGCVEPYPERVVALLAGSVRPQWRRPFEHRRHPLCVLVRKDALFDQVPDSCSTEAIGLLLIRFTFGRVEGVGQVLSADHCLRVVGGFMRTQERRIQLRMYYPLLQYVVQRHLPEAYIPITIKRDEKRVATERNDGAADTCDVAVAGIRRTDAVAELVCQASGAIAERC